jgi:hypothetical protein
MGFSAKSSLSSSSRRQAPACPAQGRRPRHLLLADEGQDDPLKAPGHRLPSHLSLPQTRPAPELGRHGRHLLPPLGTSPTPSEHSLRSPAPPSSSPSAESGRGGQNCRRHRRFPAGQPSLPPPNSPPSVLLRPNRSRRRPPGEGPVLLDPLPSLFPRRSAASMLPCRSPPWPGLPWPLRQRGLACGPRAPLFSDRGST